MAVEDKGGNKGLRHFSQKVCEKVQSKGLTTYNEVADELVAELNESGELGEQVDAVRPSCISFRPDLARKTSVDESMTPSTSLWHCGS